MELKSHLLLPFLALVMLCACVPATGSHDGRATAMADTTSLPQTNFFEIDTQRGSMVVELSDETPIHRDNFKRLAVEGFFDGTTFHRVIEGFMIQGGDPNSRDTTDALSAGSGGPGYTLEAEFDRSLFHRRGALAAARQGDAQNPERRSSGSQFYIVQGRTFSDVELDEIEVQIRQATADSTFAFDAAERETYREEGGTPFLDRQYVVFGQLVEGFDVLGRIAATETRRSAGTSAHPALLDQPIDRVPMTVRPLPDYQPE